MSHMTTALATSTAPGTPARRRGEPGRMGVCWFSTQQREAPRMAALMPMPTIDSSAGKEERIDEAELAAAAFLARYQGRTLDAYRYDLRAFFQWAADEGLVILSATRPQVELYVRAMEGRGLAPPRLTGGCRPSAASTASPTSTAGLPATPRGTSADPRSTPTTPAASTAPSWGRFCSPPSGSTTPMPLLPCSWD